MDEPALPQAKVDGALMAVEREDLDLFAVSDLLLRIERLQTEISRTQSAIKKKQGVRSAAESLFSFSKP